VGEAKSQVAEAVMDMAAELIDVQAARDAEQGTSYPPDTDWQKEFEAEFPYEPTEDQMVGAEEIKKDMQSRGRWIGCYAATWDTARPNWPCGRRSRRGIREAGGGAGSHDRAGRAALSIFP
jgi:hypothetical protein